MHGYSYSSADTHIYTNIQGYAQLLSSRVVKYVVFSCFILYDEYKIYNERRNLRSKTRYRVVKQYRSTHGTRQFEGAGHIDGAATAKCYNYSYSQ